jgi:hypothetical protein
MKYRINKRNSSSEPNLQGLVEMWQNLFEAHIKIITASILNPWPVGQIPLWLNLSLNQIATNHQSQSNSQK